MKKMKKLLILKTGHDHEFMTNYDGLLKLPYETKLRGYINY